VLDLQGQGHVRSRDLCGQNQGRGLDRDFKNYFRFEQLHVCILKAGFEKIA